MISIYYFKVENIIGMILENVSLQKKTSDKNKKEKQDEVIEEVHKLYFAK